MICPTEWNEKALGMEILVSNHQKQERKWPNQLNFHAWTNIRKQRLDWTSDVQRVSRSQFLLQWDCWHLGWKRCSSWLSRHRCKVIILRSEVDKYCNLVRSLYLLETGAHSFFPIQKILSLETVQCIFFTNFGDEVENVFKSVWDGVSK